VSGWRTATYEFVKTELAEVDHGDGTLRSFDVGFWQSDELCACVINQCGVSTVGEGNTGSLGKTRCAPCRC
jgi:hypothetical protein